MMKLRLAILLLSLSSLVFAQAPEIRPAPPAFVEGDEIGNAGSFEGDDLGRQAQVTVEFIEVSAAEATRLLYQEKLGGDGEKLRETLQQSINEGGAKVFETMMVLARSGQKATVESVREVIYPTEWDPGIPAAPKESKDAPPSPPSLAFDLPLPTAFTTRNAGSTLEVEPMIGDGNKIIDLRFAPEISFEAGEHHWNKRQDALGNELKIEEPCFYALRTTTALTLRDGVPMLFAVLSPMNAEGKTDASRKLLAIVTCDVVKPRPSKKQ
jgi:hypothetical protein